MPQLPVAHGPPERRAPPHAAVPRYYVPLPQALIVAMGRNLVAIGLYALIGRLWRTQAERGWVAVSEPDLVRLDPALCRGSARKALAKLIAGGWLLVDRDGYKTRYRPTWGVVRGRPRPWAAHQPSLGCPAKVPWLRLDQRLLDVYLGRMLLHPTAAAAVMRYVEPMLGLRDVGAYARTLRGLPTPTPALTRLGLIVDGAAVAVPRPHEILGQAAAITRQGLESLGWAPVSTPLPAPTPADPRPPVFFLAPDLAPSLLPALLQHPLVPDSPSIPTERDESPIPLAAQTAPWNRSTESNPWTLPPAPDGASGGGRQERQQRRRRERPTADAATITHDPAPAGGAARIEKVDISREAPPALLALGVHPRVARSLADAPTAVVGHCIATAHDKPQVMDVAGYVVGMLRGLQTRNWQLPPSRAAGGAFDPSAYTTGAYAGLFRRDPAVVAADPPRPTAAAAPAPPVHAPPDNAALWQQVQAQLVRHIPPSLYEASVGHAQVAAIQGSVVTLAVPSIAAREAILARWLAQLRVGWEQALGYGVQISVVVRLGPQGGT